MNRDSVGFTTLLGYITPHRSALLIMVALLSLGSALALLVPLLLGRVTGAFD